MTETKKNILTLTIALIVCLAAIEGILRLFETQNFGLISRVGEEKMTTYKPNLDMYFFDNENLKKVHVKTNKLGFMGDNFTEAKAPGTLRVVLLGDSFTAANQVDHENSFPFLLNKKLNDYLATVTSTYNKIEVINFGVGGMGTADEMKYYSTYAQKFNPDIVILCFFMGSDITDNSYYSKYKDALLSPKTAWDAVPQYGVEQGKNFVALKDRIYRVSAILRFVDRVVRSSPALNGLAIKAGLYRTPIKSDYGLDIPFWTYYYLDPLDQERAQNLKFTSDLLNNLQKQLTVDKVKFGMMIIPEGMTTNKTWIDAFEKDHPKLKDYRFDPIGTETKLVAGLDPTIKVLNLREPVTKQVLVGDKVYMVPGGEGHFSEIGNTIVTDALFPFVVSLLK